MSVDPVVTDSNTGGSFNRYAYANNSPYRYTDPDGRDARDDQIAAQLRKERERCGSYCSGGVSASGGASNSTTTSSGTAGGQQTTGYEHGGQYELNPMGDPLNPSSPGVGVAQIIAGTTFVVGVGAVVGTEVSVARLGRAAIDSNKIAHIFGQPRHNLGGVVNQFGSAEKAFQAIQTATEKATGSLGTKGVFEVTVKIGASPVTVRGTVVGGAVKIGTAFIK